MNPFRRNVLVLLGAALLIAVSVGSALGARPTGSEAGGGQAISGFVHSLVTGDREVTVDETPANEAPGDEAPADTESDCTTDADTSENKSTDQAGTANAETTADECTPDRESAPADQDTKEEASAEANAHGECVSEVAHSDQTGGDNDNHGGAVSLAARETCQEPAAAEDARKAEQAAAHDARKAEQAAAHDARKAEQATSAGAESEGHDGGGGD